MKTPRFEELAQRWAGKAQVYFIFSEEAHPRAAAKDRLVGFADHILSLDADHDGQVTLAEYGQAGPRYMFDAFDVDHDGVIKDHELLSARRIEQFADVDEATSVDERIKLARKFRAEVPGSIRVLIDGMGNPTAKAYGELPNPAFVIGTDRKVTKKIAWAAVGDVDRELGRLTDSTPRLHLVDVEPDLGLVKDALATAKTAKGRVLVHMTAPGCEACVREDETLKDPEVVAAMTAFTVAHLGIENDRPWRLFEQLDLAATPAFVVMEPDGKIVARAQGYQDKAKLLAFLK